MNVAVAWIFVIGADPDGAKLSPAAERGRIALLQHSHIEAKWTVGGFRKLNEQSKGSFEQRYGLYSPPYENAGLPMGLRRRDDAPENVVLDCMICHGGTLLGKRYIGLPNATSDLRSLFRDLTNASGLRSPPELMVVNRTRGVTNAGALGVLFIAFRNEDLSSRTVPLPLSWHRFPDLDAPAWWLLKKKKTMYCDGGMDAESTRSLMQFLLVPGRSKDKLTAAEPVWDDIRRYILSIEAPKYPFPIDADRAEEGKRFFERRCSSCHGRYGPNGNYPNRVVAIEKIGTDRARHDAIADAARDHYNKTWYGEKHPAKKSVGYQAPPLDGVWATPPYFHNGGVPTVYHVLNSTSRPKSYRRRDPDDPKWYDQKRLGFVVEETPPPSRFDEPEEQRKAFDSRRFGAGVGGHRFGDDLTDQERFAVVEYLKTL